MTLLFNNQKMELEKLNKQITNEAGKNNVQIDDDRRLRGELKWFTLQVPWSIDKDVLTVEQYGQFKTFTSKDDIIVRKTDRTSTCVFMDRTDHEARLSLTVGDTTIFSRNDEDSTETQKKKLNSLIDATKYSTNDI